jgi:iron(III) transport system permease protein
MTKSKEWAHLLEPLVWVPALFLFLPILTLVDMAYLKGAGEWLSVWEHVREHLLLRLLSNTAYLLLGVAALSLLFGVIPAWLVTHIQFPGRQFFSWALVLPLAFPAYVLAFIWVGALDYSGPLPTALRQHLGLEQNPFFWVRGLGGAIVTLSLALYPYVFVLSRNAFLSLGPALLEVSRSLGVSLWQTFWRVSLPAAKPWILSGLLLALLETVADFGAVSVMNVDTFTTGIFKAWYSLHSLPAAARLAIWHLVGVLVLMSFLWLLRGNRSYREKGAGTRDHRLYTPHPLTAIFIFLTLSFFWFAAFLGPVLQLLLWTYRSELHLLSFLPVLWQSFVLAGATAAILCLASLGLVYAKRILRSKSVKWAARASRVGYAMPGTVLSVALLIVFTRIFGPIGYLASFGLLLLLLGLCLRFFSVAFSPLNDALRKIPPSFDEASRSLKISGLRLFLRVHFPLLKTALWSAFLITFIDVIKEMPMTLMLRPTHWNTLSVSIYNFTSEGQWNEAALPALIVVALSLFPAIGVAKR